MSDLSLETPFIRAAAIRSSGLSFLIVCRVLHARMQLSRVNTRKKGLAG